MSLKDVLKSKDRELASMLNEFDSEFRSLSEDVQKEVMRLFRSGNFDRASIEAAFGPYAELLDDMVNRYAKVIDFSKQMSTVLDLKFAPTADALKNFTLIQDLSDHVLNTNIQKHINEITRFGLMGELEGKTIAEIGKDFAGLFEALGRHLNTEIYTGISMADATIKKDFFERAGIEKYYYDGPNDDKTRDDCQATLDDPRQSTGWTMDQINSSKTPYIERGGPQCRHEWLPFVED